MKKLIPVNVTSDGCAFTIVARYDGRASYLKSLMGGGGFFPATGVLEIITDEPETLQIQRLTGDE